MATAPLRRRRSQSQTEWNGYRGCALLTNRYPNLRRRRLLVTAHWRRRVSREQIAIKQQSPLDRASILAQAGTENQATQTDTTMKRQFSLARFREEERRRRGGTWHPQLVKRMVQRLDY